jgi:hypothetical protein
MFRLVVLDAGVCVKLGVEARISKDAIADCYEFSSRVSLVRSSASGHGFLDSGLL